jgi:hypothetical protein
MEGDKAHCFTIKFSEQLTLCLAGEQLEQTCDFSVFEHHRDFPYHPLIFNQSFVFPSNTRRILISSHHSCHLSTLLKSLSNMNSSDYFGPKLITTMDPLYDSFNHGLPTDGDDSVTLVYLACGTAILIFVMVLLAIAAVHNRPIERTRQGNYDARRRSLQNEDWSKASSSGVS